MRRRRIRLSYWIYLKINGESVEVPSHREGDTYAVEGLSWAEINVTWNYAKHFSFRQLNKMKGKDSIPVLEKAIKQLGETKRDNDYWKATKGNVSHCLSTLLSWAKLYPEAEWLVN